MSWTAPRTWVTGEIVTAALLNTHLRDDVIDLDRRTTPVGASVLTGESTASLSFTDLATVGPAVTVTIGATGKALVGLFSSVANATAGESAYAGYSASGATVGGADLNKALAFTAPTAGGGALFGGTIFESGFNAGVTTFTMRYRAGGGGTGTFAIRRITVQPLGS